MNVKRAWRAAALAGLMSITWALQGCGGGSDGTTAPAVTALPAAIAVSAAASAEPGAQMGFASDLSSTSTGLQFRWDFGDGAVAVGATPSHSYAQPGDYNVVLSVTNEAGAQVQARWTVAVRRSAMLQGGVCSTGTASGWCWQRPRPTGNLVVDVQWLDNSLAWAVGQGGTILRSTDGGGSWQPQASGVTAYLRKAHFVDRLNGWVIGDENTLLHTRDGGASWQAQASGEYGYASATLQVLGAQTAVLLSSSGTARVTRDGGETWSVAADNVTAVSPDGSFWRHNYNGLSRSTDLGASFSTVLSPPGANTSFGQLHVGDGVVWLVATDYSTLQGFYYAQTLWVSTDGGSTWLARPAENFNVVGASADNLTLYADGSAWLQSSNGLLFRSTEMGQNLVAVTPTGSSGTSFYAYNVNVLGPRAVAMVNGYDGQRYLTRDGGLTWQIMRLPSDLSAYAYLDSMRLLADGSLWITASGRHYRSTDSGSTWQQVFGSTPTPNGGGTALSALWFLDANQGVAVSAGGWAAETVDGGLNWTQKALTSTAQYTASRGQVQFTSSTLGWMSLGGTTLYRTTDGGKSWFAPLASALSAGVRSFHFVDASLGYALLDDLRILRSTDGGGNWDTAATLPLSVQSLRFLDAQTGVVVGSSGYIARSTDGGSHWTPRASGTSAELRRVTATAAGVLWAVGSNGTLLRSTDRGLTWTRLPAITTATLNDVAFSDALRGWAVGESGVVLATTDGGSTWQPQVTATSATLLSVFALDAYTAWISTADGGVLATGTGGR